MALRQSGTSLNFGAYGMKASTPARVTARQIEAARRAMTRHMRVPVVSGFVFSPMFLSARSRLKCGWVKVRVRLNIGCAA